MSKIRGKNTKPEMIVRRLVWSFGFRYRLYDKKLPGSPDLVFKRLKKLIFVHGCFWHGHHCRKEKLPKTRTDFWAAKIDKNKTRDSAIQKQLHLLGWNVLTIWECEVKKIETADKILNFLSD